MDNKKQNETLALSIVILVSLIGFAMIFWFYSIITPLQIKKNDTGAASINNQILYKVTSSNDSTSLQLEGNDFGRENPFDSLK